MSVANALVVIDSVVPNHQSLVERLVPGADVILLEPKRDSIEQISEALAQRKDISSLQIISHGEPGNLQLGTTQLNLGTLARNAEKLETWRNTLTEEADILLYGCDVAAGEQGQALVRELSRLTGADVAASEDLMGSAALGGDWQLEATTGQIESQGALPPQAMQTYNETLSTVLTVNTLTDENNGYGVGRNSLREAIARANSTPGTQTIRLAANGTINLARALPEITSNIVLRGSGANRITVQRNTDEQDFSIFTVAEGASFTVSGMTIAGGRNKFGGGILNDGTTTAINCYFLSNVAVGTQGSVGLTGSTGSTNFFTGRGETGGGGSAGGRGDNAGGGAIANIGTLRVIGSAFFDNAVGGGSGGFGGTGGFGGNGLSSIPGGGRGGDGGTGGNGGAGGIGVGGAIFSESGAVQIINSTFSGNLAKGGVGGTGGFGGGGGPGGLSSGETIPALGGTGGGGGNGGQSGDGYGGAIFIGQGTMRISNSTFFDNNAEFGGLGWGGEGGRGGFLGVPGIPGLSSVTPGNVRGGAIFQNGGTVRVKNTIVAGNKISNIAGRADVSGNFISLGNNLIGNSTDSNGFVARGDRAGNNRNPIAPRLGPLLYNNDSIPTHALLPGSPAIDRGSNISAPRTDGRNRPRRVDGNGDGRAIVDIGAYEAPSVRRIAGTNANNRLATTFGRDIISARGGNDIVFSGLNRLSQGDFLDGGLGRDTLSLTGSTDLKIFIDLARKQLRFVNGSQANNFENFNLTRYNGPATITGGRLSESILGGNSNDIINGGLGNDIVNGSLGNDSLVGSAGNDALVGGLGRDTLTGGVGRDRFTYTSRNQGRDRITDFAPLFDTITVSAAGFGGGVRRGVLAPTQFRLGARAVDVSDRFIYNRASGVLSFDADGTGRFAQIAIATLNAQLPLTYADILVI
jgi:Ca2+-binding RTX toxin-like protein